MVKKKNDKWSDPFYRRSQLSKQSVKGSALLFSQIDNLKKGKGLNGYPRSSSVKIGKEGIIISHKKYDKFPKTIDTVKRNKTRNLRQRISKIKGELKEKYSNLTVKQIKGRIHKYQVMP